MKHIKIIKELDLDTTIDLPKDIEVNEIFKGAFRRIVEVRLQSNAVLSRHKADVPITVFCVSGMGRFNAGSELEDSQDLRPGTMITLEADVEHEVTADPAIHLIVTKFQPN